TVIGPGGADELAEFASGHPDDLFLGVSSGSQDLPENVLSIGFDLVPPAFIAGYTAATATETGEVGAVVSRGFPQAEKILTAFDAGVDLYNEERYEGVDEVQSHRSASTVNRTIDDTRAAGEDYFSAAFDSDVDVVMPFGSAAAMGVVASADEERQHLIASAEESEDDDGGRHLPKLIWYGTPGLQQDDRGDRRTERPPWAAGHVPGLAAEQEPRRG